VLTDYARLGDVVPSLVSNEVVATRPDGVRLKQIGAAELIPGVNFKVNKTGHFHVIVLLRLGAACHCLIAHLVDYVWCQHLRMAFCNCSST